MCVYISKITKNHHNQTGTRIHDTLDANSFIAYPVLILKFVVLICELVVVLVEDNVVVAIQSLDVVNVGDIVVFVLFSGIASATCFVTKTRIIEMNHLNIFILSQILDFKIL